MEASWGAWCLESSVGMVWVYGGLLGHRGGYEKNG